MYSDMNISARAEAGTPLPYLLLSAGRQSTSPWPAVLHVLLLMHFNTGKSSAASRHARMPLASPLPYALGSLMIVVLESLSTRLAPLFGNCALDLRILMISMSRDEDRYVEHKGGNCSHL